MSTNTYLTHEQLLSALSLRDLTNPKHGIHAMQQLITEAETALSALWCCYLQRVNANPIVPVYENYDALGYPADGASRDVRYSRYVSDSLMLRTQTSSAVPTWLSSWQSLRPDSIGMISHGLVYRRDCIDRWHCAEPHQLDIWIVMPKTQADEDIEILNESVSALMKTLLPNHVVQQSKSPHPYTINGVQLDAIEGQNLIEVGECGNIDPDLLNRNGWPSKDYTGVAIGLGLDRVLMLRKGLPDIRLLRDPDSRIQQQMLDLSPWRPVSRQPKAERDISIVVNQDTDMDIIGDQVRTTLGEQAHWLEELKLLSRTEYHQLPKSAVERLGMTPSQVNLLLRISLRHPTKSVPTSLANELRNKIYLSLNQGHNYLAS
jgi:phenylalanyl-tRNA synthetase alpha chain